MKRDEKRLNDTLDAYIDLMQKYYAAKAIIALQDWELQDLRDELEALRQ